MANDIIQPIGVLVDDQGTLLPGRARTLNFTGAGVVATVDGVDPSKVNVTINGGAGGSINVSEDGAPIGPFTTLNFTDPGVTVTDGGGGQANISIPGASGGSGHFNETPTPAVDDTTTQFFTAVKFAAGTTQVYLNGLRQVLGVGESYTEAVNGLSITFSFAPPSGSKLRIDYVAG